MRALLKIVNLRKIMLTSALPRSTLFFSGWQFLIAPSQECDMYIILHLLVKIWYYIYWLKYDSTQRLRVRTQAQLHYFRLLTRVTVTSVISYFINGLTVFVEKAASCLDIMLRGVLVCESQIMWTSRRDMTETLLKMTWAPTNQLILHNVLRGFIK